MAQGPLIVSARAPGRFAVLALSSALAIAAPVLFAPESAAQSAACRSNDPSKWPPSSKPYFMLAIDTSGSMVSCTRNPSAANAYPDSCPSSATSNSCGLLPTRLNDAKCATRKTVQAFSGQVNFGLSTYAPRLTGCTNGTVTNSCPNPATGNCNFNPDAEFYSGRGCTLTQPTNGDSCGNAPDCPGASSALNALIYNGVTYSAAGSSGVPGTVGGGSVTMPADNWRNGGNIVVDMLKDTTWNPALQPATNVPELLQWFDGRTDGSREIFAAGSTPLEGMLRTVHQYYSAGWASTWADGNYCAANPATINHPSPPATAPAGA